MIRWKSTALRTNPEQENTEPEMRNREVRYFFFENLIGKERTGITVPGTSSFGFGWVVRACF